MTTSAPAVLELRAGALRLALRLDLGAAVAGLWRAGEPVLDSVEPEALVLARRSGGFVLAPYSNRLGHRRFRFDGQDHTTADNTGGGPHSMHGVAFLRPCCETSGRGLSGNANPSRKPLPSPLLAHGW